MPDIFFKCEECGKYLVADDAGAGLTIQCPDCNVATSIPSILVIHDCPRCGEKLKASAEMKGEHVECSACHREVRLPGQPRDVQPAAPLTAFLCPHCHAEVEAPEGLSERFAPCPNCEEEVHFVHKLNLRQTPNAGTKRKHRSLLFWRKPR